MTVTKVLSAIATVVVLACSGLVLTGCPPSEDGKGGGETHKEGDGHDHHEGDGHDH